MDANDMEELLEVTSDKVELEKWIDNHITDQIERYMDDHVCEDVGLSTMVDDADPLLAELMRSITELLEGDVFDVTGGKVCPLCELTSVHSHICPLWKIGYYADLFYGSDLWAAIE